MEQNRELVNVDGKELPKLTEWVNEPAVSALQADFDMAKPNHDQMVGKIRRWMDLRDAKGSARAKTGKNRSAVHPKIIRRNNEWRYSALSEPFLSADKLFKISPRTFEDVKGAQQNGLLLEWQFNEKLDKVSFVDEYVRTAVDEGTAILRVGWERVTQTVEVEKPVYSFVATTDEQHMALLQEAIGLMQSNPRGFKELPDEIQEAAHYTLEREVPVQAIQSGMVLVKEDKIVENRPTVELVHYENFYLDPSCNGDIEKANFAVITFETSKAELIKDGRYKNLDAVNWQANTPVAVPDHHSDIDESQQFRDDLRRRVVAHEYWGFYDIHKNDTLVPIVATWIGNTLIRMEENPFPDEKIPFVLVPYLPLKRSTQGEPDAELLSDHQAIIGAVTRGMIDSMGRSANGQTGFAKGMLDPLNRRRYDAGMDYEFNPQQGLPQGGIHQHQYPEMPGSTFNMLQLQNQEAEAMSGVKAFAGGLSGEAYGEVAAGIRGMLDASSKREMGILRRLAKGLTQVGKKFAAMNAIFLTEEETVRVTNEQFVSVRREDLKGNFDFKVDIATAEIDEARAQDLAFMLQTMGNNMDFSMTKMILAEIARLKRMPDLAKRIETFEPKPDPLAEKAKEQELLKLQLENEELKSKIMLNQAKARNELAEADQADLDYLEQETGTKHARDMDKQAAQAQANQDLEISKALLNPPTEGRSDIEAAMGWRQFSDILTNR